MERLAFSHQDRSRLLSSNVFRTWRSDHHVRFGSWQDNILGNYHTTNPPHLWPYLTQFLALTADNTQKLKNERNIERAGQLNYFFSKVWQSKGKNIWFFLGKALKLWALPVILSKVNMLQFVYEIWLIWVFVLFLYFYMLKKVNL